MKKLAYWLLAACPAFITLPTDAAIHTVSSSTGFQAALSQAATSPQDDSIILASGVTFTTGEYPFAYNSTDGGNLTIEAQSDAILDGGGLTEVLRLSRDGGSVSPATEDTTLFTLKNLTIQNGLDNGDARRSAGLAIYGANTHIENSIFFNNKGKGNSSGAAIYFAGERDYTLTIAESEISNNQASNSYTDTSVIYVHQAKTFELISNTVVKENAGHSGVLSIDSTPTTIIRNTQFKNNTSENSGIVNPATTNLVQIKSSQFIGNTVTSSNASGALGYGNYQIENSLFEDNTAPSYAVLQLNGVLGQYITNSRFINNNSSNQGVLRLSSGEPVISNSLFQGNSVAVDKGVAECTRSCQILNSIFVDNVGGAAIHAHQKNAKDTIIANSVFLGANPAVSFDDSQSRATMYNNFIDTSAPTINPGQLIADGNIKDEPSPGLDVHDDFRTLSGSVLINAGLSNASIVTLPNADIRGNARTAGDQVDIGWEEYGSTNTTPVITNFEFLSNNASNLELLQFRLEYQLAENKTLTIAELKTDETERFDPIELNNSIFEDVVMDGGKHTVTVKITDNAGESASQDLSFQLKTLNTEEVINRIEKNTRGLCAEKPLDCGIDTDAIRDEGYIAGKSETVTSCKTNPKDCGIDINSYIAEGKQFCSTNPEACGIEISDGSFDTTLIPSMGKGWELFGTGQIISSLESAFSGTAIVWALLNGEWHAYSANAATTTLLEQNNVPVLQAIPAHSGFWVKSKEAI